jgi:hypothetical protein
MKCGAPAPENVGRCVLTAGHTGQHWNAGGPWTVRKAWGSEPMHGTAADISALYRAMAGACEDIAAERRGEELRKPAAERWRRGA